MCDNSEINYNKRVSGMKNILFVVLPYLMERGKLPSSKLRSFKAFPYGLLSMATYARKHGINNDNIEVLDCNILTGEYYLDTLKKKISEINPDIVGLSMMFDNSYKHVKDITTTIKEYRKDTVIVMGGAATTPSYRDILYEQDDIDAICFSEGELPFTRLINSNNMKEGLENDDSWITRESLKAGKIPKKSVIKDLDEVIDIDYSFIDIADYPMKEAFSPFVGTRAEQKQFYVITSRGCPFKCAFCMRSTDNDRSMRYASVERVINHVRDLVDNYGMTVLTFYDDQLLFNKKRAKQLFKELAQFNIRIECPNGLSVAFIDDEMAYLMRKAGMDTIYLAIESGSPYVLNKIIDKPLTLDMVKQVVDRLRNNGFWIYGSFVIGFPGETDEHREETLKFIKEVGLDWSGFCHAVPYRGTKLYNICVDNGYIKKDIGIGEFDSSNYFIHTPEYAPEYITKKIYLMNLDANFVNNYRLRHGDYEIAAKAFKEVTRLYPNHAFAHYYLFKALEAAGREKELAKIAMERFREIAGQDNTWKEYAEHFKILEVSL